MTRMATTVAGAVLIGLAASLLPFTGSLVTALILWIGSLLLAGYLFGNVPVIKNNFTLVTIGIELFPAVASASCGI